MAHPRVIPESEFVLTFKISINSTLSTQVMFFAFCNGYISKLWGIRYRSIGEAQGPIGEE